MKHTRPTPTTPPPPDVAVTSVSNNHGRVLGESIASDRTIRGTSTVPNGSRPVYSCDVVIPYFKGLQWLPATIEATLTQSSVDVFVHLVHDCSPEDDADARRIFAGERRLRWYRNARNVGPYQSYHNVWSRLQTDYFVVQDADDLPMPNRLWRGLHTIESSGVDIYGAAMEQVLSRCTRGDQWNEDYVTRSPFHKSGTVGELSPFGSVLNGTMICRRETVERLNGFAALFSCSCDIEFITRAHAAGHRFYVDDAVTGIRRVHCTSLSRGGEYRLGTEGRRKSHAEWRRRYRLYKTAGADFDFAAYGCLDAADPRDCEQVG